MVCGRLDVYRDAVSLDGDEEDRGRERRRSSAKDKAGEYAVKRRLRVRGSVTKMETGACAWYETQL